MDEGHGESRDPNIGSNGTHVPDNHVSASPPLVGPDNSIVYESRELENKEAWSELQEPYVGMWFDTLVVAREHCNHHTLRVGFSIKLNTSNTSAYTSLVTRQQFYCNKFCKLMERVGVSDVVSSSKNTTCPTSPEHDAEEDYEEPSYKKKRKIETIKQTKCPPKMVVKLIDDKWEIIKFCCRSHPHTD